MRLRTPSPPPDLALAARPGSTAADDLRRVRRRARWQRLLRRAGVATAVVAGLGTATWVMGYSDLLAVRAVDVSGAPEPLAAQLAELAEVPFGEPLARVDTAAVRDRVAAVPDVASVAVSRQWPSTVGIAVVPRTPLASIADGGQWRLVDADGVVFSQVPAPLEDLPVLQAPDSDSGQQARAAGVGVAAALPTDVLVQVARIEAGSPVEVRLVLRDGRVVVWGSAQGTQRKAEVLTALLSTPASQYDVSVPDRPTLRPAS